MVVQLELHELRANVIHPGRTNRPALGVDTAKIVTGLLRRISRRLLPVTSGVVLRQVLCGERGTVVLLLATLLATLLAATSATGATTTATTAATGTTMSTAAASATTTATTAAAQLSHAVARGIVDATSTGRAFAFRLR